MELVRRHEMTKRPQPANLLCQSVVELNRRMEEKVAVRKAHYRHPGRERKRQPDSAYSQIFEWAIDDADVQREWLVDVNWLVNRCTHVADHQDAGECQTCGPAARLQRASSCGVSEPEIRLGPIRRPLLRMLTAALEQLECLWTVDMRRKGHPSLSGQDRPFTGHLEFPAKRSFAVD